MLSNSPVLLQSTTPLLECKTASIEVGALQPEEQELTNQAGTLLSRMANTEELEFLLRDEKVKVRNFVANAEKALF